MAERTVVKKVANAVLFSDGTIRIDNVRLSYPHLDKPFAGKNEEGKEGAAKYGLVGLLDKETHVEAKNLLKSVIEKMMTDNDTKVAKDKWFLRDGDDSEAPEHAGNFTVSTRESRRPTCRKRNGEVMSVDEIEDTFYGGCYANILIRPWYQDGVKVGKGYGKRINAGIIGVQFVRDGESFGEGRVNDDGAWDTDASENDDGGL